MASKNKNNNRWFSRYYRDNHLESMPFDSPIVVEDYSFSNMMYDASKGVTHSLLPYTSDPKCTRYVSDVEICMSNDSLITSHFSSEHRAVVRDQLTNQPRTPVSGRQPSDDQLMANGGIVSLERDEIVAAAGYNYSRLDSELPFPEPVSVSQPTPQPTPSPQSE